MAYQSLYRRYRPQRFGEVRGQEHLVRALQNAVREDRVGHAYLFSGPRGTGKTTTARILAKVLNCEASVDGEPCGVCESCRAIEGGTSFDVHELDAASNNKVEDIRDLINRAALGTPGRTKVYILDEVHMLSNAASNALLKTLEEPPDHVVFVLATTDPQKVLPTIKSRTQHYEVHLLPAADLESLVDDVIDDAGLEVTPEGRDYVLRIGAGSARDTLSALDQVAAAGGGAPTDLGVLDELVEALCDRDTGRALLAVDSAIADGRAPRALGEDLIGRLRDVFLAAVGADLERLADRERDTVVDQAARLGPAGATRALELLGEAFVGIQDAPDPRITLEVTLVRLTRPDADLNLAALADRITRLEREGVPAAPSAAPAAPPPPPPVSPSRRAGPPPAPVADAAGHVAEPAAPSAPGTDRRPGPAELAREELARRKEARGGVAPPPRSAVAATAESPPSPPPRPPASAPAPPGPGPAASPATAPAPAATGDGGLPSRDELTIAWGDAILPSLGRAKPRYSGGRWVAVEADAAVFGLPNAIHATKCEEVRGDVEAALAAHFGRPVPIRIVVDAGGAVPAPRDGGADDGPPTADDPDTIDLSELTDATDVATTGVERIAQVFPGAELVDGD